MRALVALALTALTATAAPVPPPPRLSEALLAGDWSYDVGHYGTGTMHLGADGTYSWATDGSILVSFGRWWVRGDELVMTEEAILPTFGRLVDPRLYVFPLTTRADGVFAGKSEGGRAFKFKRLDKYGEGK
jgi:hypothetical protein